MRRRFLIYLSSLFVLTMGGLSAIWCARQPTLRINEYTVRQIKVGMTLAEVESILGGPAGDYSTRKVVFLPNMGKALAGAFPSKRWRSNEAEIRIHFDHDDCVVYAFPNPFFPVEDTWWTRLRRWLRQE